LPFALHHRAPVLLLPYQRAWHPARPTQNQRQRAARNYLHTCWQCRHTAVCCKRAQWPRQRTHLHEVDLFSVYVLRHCCCALRRDLPLLHCCVAHPAPLLHRLHAAATAQQHDCSAMVVIVCTQQQQRSSTIAAQWLQHSCTSWLQHNAALQLQHHGCHQSVLHPKLLRRHRLRHGYRGGKLKRRRRPAPPLHCLHRDTILLAPPTRAALTKCCE
jgi:hypothetical protein